MAKPPTEITVKLDPEVMELITNLRNTVDLYVAHTENLIERMRVLEEGHDWQYMVKCHDCVETTMHDTVEFANVEAEGHASRRLLGGSRQFHAPYVLPVVKR